MKILNYLSITSALLSLLFVGCQSVEEGEALIQPRVYIEDVESPISSTITATMVPNESSSAFFYAIGTSSDREIFLGEMLEGTRYSTQSEPLEVTFDGLEGDTEYTIYACAIDADGKQGSLASYIVKSYDVELSVENLYVGAENVAFLIEANSAVYRVDYYFGESGLSDAFANDELSGVGYIIEQTYKCCNFYELDENTSYSFYAKAYDRRGAVSGVVEVPVTTASYDAIPSVEFTVGESDVYKSNYTVTPNSLCSKYHILAGELGDYSVIYDSATGYAGDVYNMMLNWVGEDWGVYSYNTEHKFYMENFGLTSTVTYEIFVLCCDAEGNPASLQRFEVATEPKEATGDAEVTIVADEITSNSASFTITPNEHTIGVLFQTYTKSTYDSYWSLYTDELYEFQLSQWQAAIYNGSSDIPWHYGSEPFTYSEVDIAAGEYYVVATPVNGAGVDAGGWGDVVTYYYEIVAEE